MAKQPLPEYERPPVIETVLGVQFKPITEWNVSHYGLFYQTIRDSFPRFEIQPPLAPQIEFFDLTKPVEQKSPIQIVDEPEFRCWYVSEDDHEIIQVQRNYFLYNWRKGDSETEYPRYEKTIRPAFMRHWKSFLSFLQSEGLSSPDVVQCQIQYVNHLPVGEGWDTVGDWHRVLRPLTTLEKLDFLPTPEIGRLNLSFLMPEKKGRLRFTANLAARKKDSKYIIVLDLIARGKPDSSDTPDIIQWMNLGREWIVRGFTDITTDSMHKLWLRER